VKGSCLCGGVKYEVTGPPVGFGFDHCSRCRKSSGSAFAAWLICKRTEFRWLAGESLVRSYVAPVKDTPPGYPRSFCGVCGGPIPDDSEEEVGIPAGTLDDDPGIRPQGHVFVEFKAPWFKITDSLPQFARHAKR
jgi:hypothetical protein